MLSQSKPGPVSNAERQRRFRQKRRRELEALRNEKEGPVTNSLRNEGTATVGVPSRNEESANSSAPSRNDWTEEAIDDALTELRRSFERVDAQLRALLTNPGLTASEIQTVRYRRFTEARKDFERVVTGTPRRAQTLTLVQPSRRRGGIA